MLDATLDGPFQDLTIDHRVRVARFVSTLVQRPFLARLLPVEPASDDELADAAACAR